jgi:hypothetical protein
MSSSVAAARLAALLTMLKNRRDRSYVALARRTGLSSSTLQRYCAGTTVPTDFGVVRRFAQECGASPEELRELHRAWAVADSARRSPPPPP